MAWYPWALDRLGLKWIHVTFSRQNAIERYFRTLKEHLRGFYGSQNARSKRIMAVEAMAQILAYGYNYLRANQNLGALPLG